MKPLLVVLFGITILFEVLFISAKAGQGVERQCINELKLDELYIREAHSRSDTPVDDDQCGKFYVCMWKKGGVMDDKGAIIPVGLANYVSAVFVTALMQEGEGNELKIKVKEGCSTVQGSTEKRTAVRLKNCIAVVVQKHYQKTNKHILNKPI